MLYYIGHYNCDLIRNEDRLVAPAAENKISYILSALLDACNETIQVISPAETKQYRVIKGRKQKIHERIVLRTFPTFNSKIRLIRIMGHLLTRISFLLYLLLNINSKDHLIVYHSLAYINVIKWIHHIKNCKLTIEVEELYCDVKDDERLRRKEIRYLQIADSYLFVNEILKEIVNAKKKSFVCHGTYQSVIDYRFRFDDGKIHVVYAGSFRKAKGAVFTAIAAAEYLDDKYVLEILGTGSREEIADVHDLIDEISVKTTCRIKYAGFKTGVDFNKYIQACHIGLCTRPAEAKFCATSFPSKILMYMSNGLKVVSVRIPAVETSLIGDNIFYYDSQDAKSVAEAIKSVPLEDEYDSRKVLDGLHKEFVEQLKDILVG